MVKIPINRERLAAFCNKHQIRRMWFFGSVLRSDFSPESDIDVLVEFMPEAKHTLFDLVRMEAELKDILGRKVDLLTRHGVETSRNYLRKKAILESAEVVYGT
jgi:hypothetical protein